jgi:PAS domain S-box-containing protein
MDEMQRNEVAATDASRRNTPSATALERLIDVLPVGVFTLGPDQRLTTLNAEAARLTGVAAADALGQRCSDLFRCDLDCHGCAAELARKAGAVCRDLRVGILHADGTPRTLRVDAVPLAAGEVALAITDVTELERARRAHTAPQVFHGMAGGSAAFQALVERIRTVAPTESTVLVLGESGTGKELVARALHAESPRAAGPFVTVNCAALSEGLLESELFGHVRGAFTGADRDRVGRFESASGGTLFLDEVGEIPLRLQVKLLRVLQEREIERVGETRTRHVDVRVVAATHRDLAAEVRAGSFREDLYYRLNVVALRLPPLRERPDDLPALIDVLLQRAALRVGKEVLAVDEDARARLGAHTWPGNVRELENVLESAVVACRDGVVRATDLPEGLAPRAGEAGGVNRVEDALRRAAGSVTLAASLLGVHRTTLWRWMTERGLDRKSFRPS